MRLSAELRRILLEAFIILLLGAAVGLTANYRLVMAVLEGRPVLLPARPEAATAEADAMPPAVAELEEVRALLAAGALAVDARIAELYAEGHLPGARSLPFEEVETALAAFRREVPDSTAIVTYCSGQGCPDSHDLALRLLAAGYRQVRVFEGGFPAWREAGLPVETGAP